MNLNEKTEFPPTFPHTYVTSFAMRNIGRPLGLGPMSNFTKYLDNLIFFFQYFFHSVIWNYQILDISDPMMFMDTCSLNRFSLLMPVACIDFERHHKKYLFIREYFFINIFLSKYWVAKLQVWRLPKSYFLFLENKCSFYTVKSHCSFTDAAAGKNKTKGTFIKPVSRQV